MNRDRNKLNIINMKAGASIVNVASIAGVKGCGGAAYVASKDEAMFSAGSSDT